MSTCCILSGWDVPDWGGEDRQSQLPEQNFLARSFVRVDLSVPGQHEKNKGEEKYAGFSSNEEINNF